MRRGLRHLRGLKLLFDQIVALFAEATPSSRGPIMLRRRVGENQAQSRGGSRRAHCCAERTPPARFWARFERRLSSPRRRATTGAWAGEKMSDGSKRLAPLPR